MRAESQDLRESMTKLDRKEWREPRLRRLPIAATASSKQRSVTTTTGVAKATSNGNV